jgi:hypothetical protein
MFSFIQLLKEMTDSGDIAPVDTKLGCKPGKKCLKKENLLKRPKAK